MKFRWLSTFLVLTLAVLGLTANVAYSQTTGDIEGTVSDTNGSSLPGASVEIKSPALQGTRMAVTDAAGRFRFPVLPSGSYTLTAALSGFTKVEKTNIRVTLGATATLPITLSVSVKEEIVVTAEAPVVDTAHGIIGATTSAETIQRLPLARNFTAIAQTVAGTGTSVGGGLTVYGATGLENQYVIDGVNTTGVKIGDVGKTMNQEFIQEIEIKTGGYEAEYSKALGGIVNVVTKSGGNEFHGDLFGYSTTSNLATSDKRTTDRAAVGQGAVNPASVLDGGADVGGYFLKDRIWFFGAYDRTNQDQKNNITTSRSLANGITTQQQTDTTRTDLFSGKLTFRLGDSNTLTASVFGDPGTFEGNLPFAVGIIGPPSTQNGTEKRGGTDISAKYDGIFGTMFLIQAQYGYHTQQTWDTPLDTSLSIRNRQNGISNYSGGMYYYTQEKYRRDDYKLSASGFFGSHDVKVGLEYETLPSTFTEFNGGADRKTNFLSASGAYQYSGDRYYAQVPLNCLANTKGQTGNLGQPGANNPLVPNIQSCLGYSIALNGVQNNPSTQNTGFFAQDSWKVLHNLTVNAGLRYDNQNLKDAEGNDLIKLTNEWSPRIGVVWDAANNGKSKVYGSYGRYYTVIPQDVQTRALGNEYATFSYNYSQSKRDPVSDPNLASYAYIQGGELSMSGLKGSYLDELVLGVEYEVFKNWSIGVKGIYKGLGRAIDDRCDLQDPRVNLSSYVPAGALTTCALTNLGASGTGVDFFPDPTNPACVAADGTLTGNCQSMHASRIYRGVELDLNHRFSDQFYVLASYVYSKLVGNFDGNEQQNNGQQDPNINANFDYVDMVPNSYGPLSLDHRHVVKISGMYSFPFGLNAGGTFNFMTGAPFAISGYARAGYYTERYLTPDRGFDGNMPSIWEANLHLDYGLRLGPVTVSPVLDVFNLFNRQGVTNVHGVFNQLNAASNNPAHQIGQPGCTAQNASYANKACATDPNYMLATQWQNPRTVRLGARLSF